MNNITQEQLKPINLTVLRDGIATEEFQPSALNTASAAAFNGLHAIIEHIKLESRLIAFDITHGTDYRNIRHALKAEQKKRAFESSIGLERVS